MFSNRSVSVQPSPPPMEYALVPDAFSVFAALSSAENVFGVFTPAFLKSFTLYQMVDLLAPLRKRPYSFPFTVPSESQPGDQSRLIVFFMNAIGLRVFFLTSSRMNPGCGISAMSGGLPPATCVERIVVSCRPADVYFVSMSG